MIPRSISMRRSISGGACLWAFAIVAAASSHSVQAGEWKHDRLEGLLQRRSLQSQATRPAPAPAPSPRSLQRIEPEDVLRYNVAPGLAGLACLVTIDSFRIFIDAENRALLHLYRDQHSGLARKVFDLKGGTRHPDVVVFDDASAIPANNGAGDATTAFANSKKVYEYFFRAFGGDSFDDNDDAGPLGGAPLESTVRYGTVENAFWCVRMDRLCPKANVMVYGPGYAGAIDVVGHEMSHGVIAHEARLIYDGQFGAVNEALADIFVALIEHEQGGGNWIIGEALPGFSLAAPMRSLADPRLTDPDGQSRFHKGRPFAAGNNGQPNHMTELVAKTDKICSTTADALNGCVHFNSGILNKAAFLIAQGGTHSGVAVTGIGLEKLGRIAYRALTVKLGETSGLADAGEAFLVSCLELSGEGLSGFTGSDCDSLERAVQAVGLAAGS